MNSKLFFWSITVALGGLLFGLDTAVISGAEQAIQKFWQLDSWTHGLAVAIALYGTVIGALFASVPTDGIGRKKTLMWIGILFFFSAIGAAMAQDIYVFMAFRFMGGVAIGASSVTAPVYISEIAPANKRGFLVALFQFNIVFGILLAYVSNYLLADVGHDAWRWMLGVVAIPSLLFTVMMIFVPESPRWLLMKRNDDEGARAILRITDPDDTEGVLQSIKKGIAAQTSQTTVTEFFGGKYRLPIMLAILFAVFNQVSGINAVIYFAPRIFEMTGSGKSVALLSTAGIGVVNLIATMLGLALIDRFGRRSLMFVGSVGYIISLGLIANAFFTQSYGGVIIYIFMFIASHAIGQGAVIWVFISEIFPTQMRGYGQSLGSFTHWIFAAIITNVFPPLAESLGGGKIFTFFCLMMVLQLLYVWFLMPETKGVSLEDLEKRMVK